MELSEHLIKMYEQEGFSSIYEQKNTPGKTEEVYIPRSSSLSITDGELTIILNDKKQY